MSRCIKSLLNRINNSDPCRWNVCAGFDGFIDTIARPLRSLDAGRETPFVTMRAFGEYLMKKAGKSCGVGLKTEVVKMGGNSPLFASALSRLNPRIDLISCIGKPEIDPVFRPLGDTISLTSVGNPGKCISLEFDDGKVMLSDNTETNKLDYAGLLNGRKEAVLSLLRNCDLLALLNWSEMLGMTDIWKGIGRDVIEADPGNTVQRIFIDLTDCSSRSDADITEMRAAVSRFGQYRRVLLSLNENEAAVLCSRYGIRMSDKCASAREIRRVFGIEAVVIHTLYSACISSGMGDKEVATIHVEHPAISTGGGDHFNAGLAYAWMENYPDEEMLALANAVGACYVQDGVSPAPERIVRCLKQMNQALMG